MFDPGWSDGCKSCSFWADNYDGMGVHVAQRDVTMVTISRAPLPTLEAFKRRMGWTFTCTGDIDRHAVWHKAHEHTFPSFGVARPKARFASPRRHVRPA